MLEMYKPAKATLGYLPDGGFEDYIDRGRALLLVDQETELACGYLIFRQAGKLASVAHVCVAPTHQGRGLAHLLLGELKARPDLSAIRLHCRRDFERANRVWKKAGFHPVAEIDAKTAGKILQIWQIQLRPDPDLFDSVDRLKVVLDMNVFLDLHADDAARGDESRALDADWVRANVELWLTPETYFEIDRNKDRRERERRRRAAGCYRKTTPLEDLASVERALRDAIGTSLPTGPSSESDLRQLAGAAAAGASAFLTRDERVLRLADQIQAAAGLRVVRPSTLLLELDEFERGQVYDPRSLGLTSCVTRAPKDADLKALAGRFVGHGTEKARMLEGRLRAWSSTRTVTVELFEKQGEALSLSALERGIEEWKLPLVRVAKAGRLAATVAHSALWRAVVAASKRRVVALRLEDLTDPDVVRAAASLGFTDEGGYRMKRFCYGVQSLDGAELRGAAADGWERLHWPGMLRASGLQTWVVPIQPMFAARLFDQTLAETELFGVPAELLLGPENIYYSGAVKARIEAPARLLWYVSSPPRSPGYGKQSCIVAVSRLCEVNRGRPREVYQRHSRLGVFGLSEVEDTASDGRVLALRFSYTELLPKRVPLSQIREITGKDHYFPGPTPIPDDHFADILDAGRS
jgi:GNAT superfamily N-acetyltransferase